MKRIIKNKFLVCIIAALVALLAAVFACLFINKNDAVEAHAETEITPTIYWRYISSDTTLELSSSSLSGGTDSGSFASDAEFDSDIDTGMIMTPWYQYASSITTVNISTLIAPVRTDNWFCGLNKLNAIENIANLDTSNAVSISGMFYECSGLTTLDLSNFDTSNVIYCQSMFCMCSSLVNLNVSNWNVSSVLNFNHMFNGCSSLKTLDLSNWNNSSLRIMANMFTNCSALEAVDLSGFDVSHSDRSNPVYNLFRNATSLKKVKLSDSIVVNIASGGSDSDLTFPLYDADGNQYNSASEMTKGGAYFKTKHTHDYKLTSTTPATCVDAGEKVLACLEEYCADVQTETIPATGVHSFTNYVSNNDASCFADGTKTATCDNCTATETITDTGTATGNHSFTNYVSNNDATCTEDGTKTAHCDTSGCTATETITDTGSATGLHSFTNYVSDGDADCTTDGHETATCDVCHSATDNRVAVGSALDHDFSITLSGTQPTCQQGGSATMKCSRCEETQVQNSANPVDHVYTNYVSDGNATCTADGTKTAHCDFDCGETDTIADVGSATGHTPGDAATCTTAQTCTVCGTQLAEAMGHTTVVDEAKAPTCTEAGLTEGAHCSVCDEVLTAQEEVPALGHDYQWEITIEPTEEAEGLKEEKCTRCDDKRAEEVLAKLVVDDNGNVSDLPVLPPNQDYDLEISVKESDAIYVFDGEKKSISKGFKVELFIVGEDGESTPFDEERTVTLMLHIPDGMEEFTLYKRVGNILEPVALESYTVDGRTVKIKTTLPNEFVFNSPAPEDEEPAAGIPWWVWLLVVIGCLTVVGVVIVIIVVIKKKNGGDGGTTVVQGTQYDDAELKAKLSEQDRKLDEIKEIVDGGFNDFVDE